MHRLNAVLASVRGCRGLQRWGGAPVTSYNLLPMEFLRTHPSLVIKWALAVIIVAGVGYWVYALNKADREHRALMYISCVQKAENTFQSAMRIWCALDDHSSPDTCNNTTLGDDMDFATYYRAKYPNSVPATLLTNYEDTKTECGVGG